MIIPTLLFLLFKNDAFHAVGMKGKTLSTYLDSFSMLTTAQKSKLKKSSNSSTKDWLWSACGYCSIFWGEIAS